MTKYEDFCNSGTPWEDPIKEYESQHYVREQTQNEHTTNTRHALQFLRNNLPMEHYIRDEVLSEIKTYIVQALKDAALEMSDYMKREMGLNVSPTILEVLLSDRLEDQVAAITDLNAGWALCEGDVKSNIARAGGVNPGNCAKRFPNIEEICQAYREVIELHESRDVRLRDGSIYTIESITD